MVDEPQTKNLNVSLGSVATGFLSTVWGKLVAVLAAISLIMGIALEVQSFVTGYYVLQKAKADAKAAEGEAEAASAKFKGVTPTVHAQTTRLAFWIAAYLRRAGYTKPGDARFRRAAHGRV